MTTNTQHTPGSWTIIETDEGLTINTIREQYDPPIAYVHLEADARLIAAAPDLLEAAQRLVHLLEVEDAHLANYGEVAAVRAAIAKAEGGSLEEGKAYEYERAAELHP
jgi:hypothetical protein